MLYYERRAPAGRYVRVSLPPAEGQRAEHRQNDAPPPGSRAPAAPGGILTLLPRGLDAGDIMLAAVLLFLYIETRDEDFLVILIVVGLSMLKSSGEVT